MITIGLRNDILHILNNLQASKQDDLIRAKCLQVKHYLCKIIYDPYDYLMNSNQDDILLSCDSQIQQGSNIIVENEDSNNTKSNLEYKESQPDSNDMTDSKSTAHNDSDQNTAIQTNINPKVILNPIIEISDTDHQIMSKNNSMHSQPIEKSINKLSYQFITTSTVFDEEKEIENCTNNINTNPVLKDQKEITNIKERRKFSYDQEINAKEKVPENNLNFNNEEHLSKSSQENEKLNKFIYKKSKRKTLNSINRNYLIDKDQDKDINEKVIDSSKKQLNERNNDLKNNENDISLEQPKKAKNLPKQKLIKIKNEFDTTLQKYNKNDSSRSEEIISQRTERMLSRNSNKNSQNESNYNVKIENPPISKTPISNSNEDDSHPMKCYRNSKSYEFKPNYFKDLVYLKESEIKFELMPYYRNTTYKDSKIIFRYYKQTENFATSFQLDKYTTKKRLLLDVLEKFFLIAAEKNLIPCLTDEINEAIILLKKTYGMNLESNQSKHKDKNKVKNEIKSNTDVKIDEGMNDVVNKNNIDNELSKLKSKKTRNFKNNQTDGELLIFD